MATHTYTTVESLLSEKRLVRSMLPSSGVTFAAAGRKEPLKLVYGETYDAHGFTIDSLKYYFFISILQKLLVQEGTPAEASIIIGDLHSVKNKIVTDKESLLSSAAARLDLMGRIKTAYSLDFEPALMSNLFNDPAYAERLATITPIFRESDELQSIAKKTVLANRLAQEEKAGFQYTLEEVALITGFDVKIGPPREVHYDNLARLLGAKIGNDNFRGLYLTPTYPLGLGFDYFVTHPEIEEFGLTPYKAGSNKLQANRIVLGVTTPEQCQQLINSSFAAPNPILPNPVLDLYLITQMAASLLHGTPLSIDEDLVANVPALKAAVHTQLIETIYKPLGLAT